MTKISADELANKCAKRVAGWLLNEEDFKYLEEHPEDDDWKGLKDIILSETGLAELVKAKEEVHKADQAASDNAEWFDSLCQELKELTKATDSKPSTLISIVKELVEDREKLDWVNSHQPTVHFTDSGRCWLGWNNGFSITTTEKDFRTAITQAIQKETI